MINDNLFSRCRLMLKRDEGIVRKPYRCPAGYITIGIGRNLEGKELSDKAVDFLLREDIEEALITCKQIFGKQFETFSEVRQLALINLAFNLGYYKLSQFKRTIAAIKAGQWKEAAENLLKSKYAMQVKSRANRVALMLSEEGFPYP